eukprot:3173363-Rhodomonas_salina.1
MCPTGSSGRSMSTFCKIWRSNAVTPCFSAYLVPPYGMSATGRPNDLNRLSSADNRGGRRSDRGDKSGNAVPQVAQRSQAVAPTPGSVRDLVLRRTIKRVSNRSSYEKAEKRCLPFACWRAVGGEMAGLPQLGASTRQASFARQGSFART